MLNVYKRYLRACTHIFSSFFKTCVPNPCLFVFSLVVTRKLYIGTLPNVKSRITTAYHKEQPNGQANTSPSFCCRPM